MSHANPASILSWAFFAALFEIFLLTHLYRYDRFKCLRFGSGGQPGGSFRKIMLVAYLSIVPLLLFYSVATTFFKYYEGYIILGQYGIQPKPVSLWHESSKTWTIALNFVLSVSWSLELTTHLEEFAFWTFVIQQGPAATSWFSSRHCLFWVAGSLAAIIGMPAIVLVTMSDIDTCEGWVFFSGSLASILVTVLFLWVLFVFPEFLRNVEKARPDPMVIGRLRRVQSLNIGRVISHFCFTVPLFLLAIDGLWGSRGINGSVFWSDFIIMLAGLSCIISSAFLLFIFFPLDNDTILQGGRYTPMNVQSTETWNSESSYSSVMTSSDSPIATKKPTNPFDDEMIMSKNQTLRSESEAENDEWSLYSQPSRAPSHASRYPILERSLQRAERNLPLPVNGVTLHPYIATYRSPIELIALGPPTDHTPRAV